MNPRPKGFRYVPGLDGVRAAAVLSVMVFHVFDGTVLPGGWLGVDVFFVLSGFLITSLLIAERDRTGRVSLSDFYLRRAVRLLPALIFFLAGWAAVMLVFQHRAFVFTTPENVPITNPSFAGHSVLFEVAVGILGALFYVVNWLEVLGHFHAPILHLWSLSIEEQFYIVWPPMLLVAVRKSERTVFAVASVGAVTSALWAIAVWFGTGSYLHVYYGTDCRAQELLLGCALAIAWKHRWIPAWIYGRGATAIALMTLAAFWALLSGRTPARFWGTMTVAAAASAVIIVRLTTERPGILHTVATHSVAVYIGQRSYGLYLWHYAFATWLDKTALYGKLLAFPLTAAAAELSWRLVEVPARRIVAKRRRVATPYTAPTP